MTTFPIENLDDLFYRIEQWNDAGDKPVRVLAAACDYRIASGAFIGAVRSYRHRRITMREGIKVNRSYVPPHLKKLDQRSIEQLLEAHEIPADWSAIEPMQSERHWYVLVRSASGKDKQFGIGDLQQFVSNLQAHGHGKYAEPFAQAIWAAHERQFGR